MDRTVQDRNFIEGKCKYVPDWDTPRYRLTPPHTAYIKIAEGCNHGCAYCIIPMIRGRHRSRSQQDVVREAEALIRSGVKEICLIAQDITYYGMDKWTDARPNRRSAVDSSRGESLASLIRALNAIEGEFWIRLLYTHPAHWSDELTAAIAESPKGPATWTSPSSTFPTTCSAPCVARDGRGLHPQPPAGHPEGRSGNRHPHHLHHRIPRRDGGRPSGIDGVH